VHRSSWEEVLAIDYSIMEYTRRSRGLAIEFALLGYLVETPMHGYELRDRLSQGLGALWRIASSQLYQVLRRLRSAGWVESSVEAGSSGPSRNVYRITTKGVTAFWDWAAAPVAHMRQIRIEFFAKLYFVRRLAPARVADLVARQIAVLRALHTHLCMQEQVESDDVELGKLAASYRRSQVESTIRWLEESAAECAAGGKETQ